MGLAVAHGMTASRRSAHRETSSQGRPRLSRCGSVCDAKIPAQKLDEIITFLSHTTSFAVSISTCDVDQRPRTSMKTKWRKRVRVERTGDIRDAARRF